MTLGTLPVEFQRSTYDYPLEEASIAQFPCPDRDRSRLLVLDRETGEIRHRLFHELVDCIRPGDALVLNNSRVVPARLAGRKIPGGGKVQVLLLRRRLESGDWEAMVRGSAGRGQRIEFPENLVGIIGSKTGPGRKAIAFENGADPESVWDRAGLPPLPPYIRRDPDPADRERYQTVYASVDGSVAAPTAGLHFTRALLEGVRRAGGQTAEVTLHVGPGTFQPLRSEDIRDHRMDCEWFELPSSTAEVLENTRRNGGRIIAVGTTAARVLESVHDPRTGFVPRSGWTDLFILPGHRFRAVDALITNFHYPQSTLMVLVSALAGLEPIRRAYAEARAEGYRFLSFGDAMFIL